MDSVGKVVMELPRVQPAQETGSQYVAPKATQAEQSRRRIDEASMERKARAEQAKDVARDEPPKVNTQGGTYLRFVIDKESHDLSVMVVDQATKQIVRRVPPKDLAQFLQDRWQAGFAVDIWA